MGRLVRFPSSQLKIYLPVGASPEDSFEAFVISDNSLDKGTIYQGDIVVIKVGLVQKGGLHVVETPAGHIYAGFLVEKKGGLVSIESNSNEYGPETYKRDQIRILGRVVQVYPGGDTRERWEFISSRRIARKKARVTAK